MFSSGNQATGPVPGAHFDYLPATPEILAKVGAMEEIARKHGAPLAQPAIQFPLRNQSVASVLIGTAKPESLVRNMQLVEPRLPDGLYAEFEGLTVVAPPLGDEAVRV